MRLRHLWGLLILTAALPVSAQVKGVVLGPGGKPAPGAQIWSGDPRIGVRADAKGEFSLVRKPSGGRLWAGAGSLLGEATLVRGQKVVIRIEATTPLSAAERSEVGLDLLQTATAKSQWHRPALFMLLAHADAASARKTVRDDADRAAILGALAGRNPRQGATIAAEVRQLANNFERCRAANQVALALMPHNPDAARMAFLEAHTIWEAKSIGGNDLLFPYAALSARFLPEKADSIIADADGWAKLHPKPHDERMVLALALGAVDPKRADLLMRQLPPPYDAIGLARLVGVVAPGDPTAGLSLLQEAQRRGQDRRECFESRGAALASLLPLLEKSQPGVALKLVQAEPLSDLTMAWTLRFNAELRAPRLGNLRRYMEEGDLSLALMTAEVCASTPEGKEALGAVRSRFFVALNEGAVSFTALMRFIRLIAARDPAAARAALERAWLDVGENATERARLAPLLALVDPQRARMLIDTVNDEEQAAMARGVVGAFLRTGRFPTPLE